MKKQLSIGLAILASTFIACNEDDDLKYNNVNRMIGEWKLTKIGLMSSSNQINYVAVSENCASTLVFSDSTFVENMGAVVDGTCQTTTTSGSYRIENGDLIRIVSGSPDVSYDILTLTNTDLELIHSDDETSELSFFRFAKQVPVETEE